ncbi:MAG TPA: tail fiber domain-containing protein [Methylocella sp.]|nr:tail fiber domain-containing protein [Methylocella sp.]
MPKSVESSTVNLSIAIALAWFALSPVARAVLPPPPPDGGYSNANTAEGDLALRLLTTGESNTAIGFDALGSNTAGSRNTATGFGALVSNTTGRFNTAAGVDALANSSTSDFNTATGSNALIDNTTGASNTATGVNALFTNTTGSFNTAIGVDALEYATAGNNTATGYFALRNNTTGSNNIAMGIGGGVNLTTGSNNIEIGNQGVARESNTIRIGTVGTQKATFIAGIRGATVLGGITVVVGPDGHLGTSNSSARFKEAIKPMGKASEAILALKPVTFRYKHKLDPEGIPQFGLVAEQVEKVNPDLIARDHQGKVITVRYEAVNAMLLNEFLKEHRKVQELEATIARQQKEIEALAASLKEQTLQISTVRAASLH